MCNNLLFICFVWVYLCRQYVQRPDCLHCVNAGPPSAETTLKGPRNGFCIAKTKGHPRVSICKIGRPHFTFEPLINRQLPLIHFFLFHRYSHFSVTKISNFHLQHTRPAWNNPVKALAGELYSGEPSPGISGPKGTPTTRSYY